MNGKQTVMQYRFIIQVNCPGQKLDMSAIRALFEDTGVELNSSYGPIVINPKLGRHVVRGEGHA